MSWQGAGAAHLVSWLIQKCDHPITATGLVAAGFAPVFPDKGLHILYWCLVLPPAATAFAIWAYKYLPPVRWAVTKVRNLLR